MKIGDRIREARKRAGMSQAELAARAWVYPSQISNYERGLVTPRWRVLSRIAKALGVPVGDLIYKSETPRR